MFKKVNLTGLSNETLYLEGIAATQTGDFQTAESCFRLLLNKENKNPPFNQLYVESLIAQFKYDIAKRTLDKLIKKDLVPSRYLDLRARLCMLSGNLKQSEKDLNSIIQYQPTADQYKIWAIFTEATTILIKHILRTKKRLK